LGERIPNPLFAKLIKTLNLRIRKLTTQSATPPEARNYYTAVLTANFVNGHIIYLTDTEMEALWRFYHEGEQQMKRLRPEADEWAQFGRAYFEALINVFGYNIDLELSNDDDEMKLLRASMAAMKVDLFAGLETERLHATSRNNESESRADLVMYLNSEMLTNYRMYCFAHALDWFGLQCFARTTFVPESVSVEDLEKFSGKSITEILEIPRNKPRRGAQKSEK